MRCMPNKLTGLLWTLTLLLAIGVLGCGPASKKNAESKNVGTTNSGSDGEKSSGEESDNTPVNGKPISGELNAVDWDSMVGQEVTIEGDLVVVDTYDLARRGQVKVARKRLYIPSETIDPNDSEANRNSVEGGSNVAEITKAQRLNDTATIILDDGPADQNVFPIRLFPGLGAEYPSVRTGSLIHGVSGKLVKAGKKILLVPNAPLTWTPATRPARPNVGDAKVVVASFNVLNYFSTLDDGSNNARGADSESELKRQEDKIVAAIIALKADVIGVMELENNLAAEVRLVNALNSKSGKEIFAGCGTSNGFRETAGGKNAIRVGIIYRKDRVEPQGKVAHIDDPAFAEARTPIVQTFQSVEGGKPFTLIVNHFKSKGGSDRADAANKNQGDGQGAYNPTRRSQSLAICKYIKALKAGNDNQIGTSRSGDR